MKGEDKKSHPMQVYHAVIRERNYQGEKRGDNAHTVGEWLLILERELNEAKEGWVTGQGDADALQEILQVIAVGVACLEQHGIAERPSMYVDIKP